MNIGGTTQILSTFKKIKTIQQKIERNGWKKLYDNKE